MYIDFFYPEVLPGDICNRSLHFRSRTPVWLLSVETCIVGRSSVSVACCTIPSDFSPTSPFSAGCLSQGGNGILRAYSNTLNSNSTLQRADRNSLFPLVQKVLPWPILLEIALNRVSKSKPALEAMPTCFHVVQLIVIVRSPFRLRSGA